MPYYKKSRQSSTEGERMNADLWSVFERLADDIEARLRAGREDHVSSAAEESLQSFAPELGQVDRAAYLKLLVADAGMRVAQSWPNDYGDPTFTVVRRKDFRIEVIFWDQAFNPPHDHVSCGAFMALHGHRLNRDFGFRQLHAYSETLSAGDLRAGECTYMMEGDTHYIQPEMIHDMFWIDLPVTTVAVRCVKHPVPLQGPPRSYLGGGLATVRPRFRGDATLNTLRKGLKTLTRMQGSEPEPSLVAELAKNLALGDYVYLVTDSARLGRSALERMVDAIPQGQLDDNGVDVVDRLKCSISDIVSRYEIARTIGTLRQGPTRLALGFLWLGQTAEDARLVLQNKGIEPEAVVPESVMEEPEIEPYLDDWTAAGGPVAEDVGLAK